ncbi:MAG: hypothetical protein K9J27_10645 [Bacteroidales bacterium]|nr:hypothetical protein [Bacteroidales bacterium]MCF8338337.1 hypothetical protein [Bacteroidales bacterium]
MKSKNDLFAVAIGAVFLCFFLFYNRYPIAYVDTGAYILKAFVGKFTQDRPMFYGWFIQHISLKESLYLVSFAQGLLISSLVLLFFKYFMNRGQYTVYFVVFIILISFFTGASFHVSRLMPDAFTPVFLLSMILLLYVRKMKLIEVFYVSILYVYSMVSHNTHMMLNILLIVVIIFYLVVQLIRKKHFIFPVKRLLLVGLLTGFGFLLLSLSALQYNGKFGVDQGGHVFMMNRLLKMGLLEPYLEEYCPEKDYKICQYEIDRKGFLWNNEKSPVYKQGGWDETKKQYKRIIFDLLTTPKYTRKFIARSVEGVFKQFFSFEIGNRGPYGKDSWPYKNIERFYSDQAHSFLSSKQNNGLLETYLERLNTSQYILITLSFIILSVWIFNHKLWNKLSQDNKHLIIFILIAVVANAIITGTFTNIRNRFQSRVIWLIVLPAFMIVVNYGKAWFHSKFIKSKTNTKVE